MSDPELSAMQKLFETLEPLDEGARGRVLSWVAQRLAIKGAPESVRQATPRAGAQENPEGKQFGAFADLFNAVAPSTNADKALTAGYWLQVCQWQNQFASQVVNKELQHLGHGIGNVTDAFRQLQRKKPALAIQVKKSGKSQQARKLYKLTQAGIDMINAMTQVGSRQ